MSYIRPSISEQNPLLPVGRFLSFLLSMYVVVFFFMVYAQNSQPKGENIFSQSHIPAALTTQRLTTRPACPPLLLECHHQWAAPPPESMFRFTAALQRRAASLLL